jgi:hypothetical protein
MSDLADELDDHARLERSLSVEIASGEVAPVDVRKRLDDAISRLEGIRADAAKL